MQQNLTSKAQPKDKLGRIDLHYAANDGNLLKAQELILSGADVNHRDKKGWTPLHFAAQAQNSKLVSLLLESGAEVDALDSNGNTPLSGAVFNYRSDGSVIEILRSFGANPYCQNNYGQTPIGLARLIANYDVASYFSDLE